MNEYEGLIGKDREWTNSNVRDPENDQVKHWSNEDLEDMMEAVESLPLDLVFPDDNALIATFISEDVDLVAEQEAKERYKKLQQLAAAENHGSKP